jgi:hypothetical protein
MPSWVLAVFIGFAALVPAGVFFTASFLGYTYEGFGTGSALSGAPGPLLGAGIVPALLAIGAAYFVGRRSRRGPSKD